MFTFEIEEEIPNVLYAMRWDEKGENALNKGIIQLQDPEYLTQFFMARHEKLRYYNCTVTEAVTKTHREANKFLQNIRTKAENARLYQTPDLDQLFSPLHREAAFGHYRYKTDYKAKGFYDTIPWVRVYAVRCCENLYVITGVGIKLVKKMQEDEHLKRELLKLKKATNYLKQISML